MKEPDNVIQNTAPLPAIRLSSREQNARHERAGLFLVIFMRAIALLWLLEGALHWASLLADDTGQAFATLSAQRTAAVFFFCVLDFVAAVGLWLTTPWGGVVWLVTIGAQILAVFVLPGFFGYGAWLLLSDCVLVPAYLFLAWYAGHGATGSLDHG